MKFPSIVSKPFSPISHVAFCHRQHTYNRYNQPTTKKLTIAGKINQHQESQSVYSNLKFSNSNGLLSKKWMECQGVNNWEGMLDPLDETLRGEILRYGQFVEAAYRSFDFDPASPTYATCRFPRNSLLTRSGMECASGYRITKNLKATCGMQLPEWLEKAPKWVTTNSSWIGYVAVCQDKDMISRLGRRDVVIAYRGTATCLEWLENLRVNLTSLTGSGHGEATSDSSIPMVEKGFLSMYTSETATCRSLRDTVREEVKRILEMYGNEPEPVSFTITGHSLGAALATLTAFDIGSCHDETAMMTVVSFGGPRLGNASFRRKLEKSGTKVLRIVNSDDVITKVPGLVMNEDDLTTPFLAFRSLMEKIRWDYADLGQELRLSSKECPHLRDANVATCHELRTYLHLVDGFVSSTCPFRNTAKRMIQKHKRQEAREAGSQFLLNSN